MNRRDSGGFTLVEMLVAVMIFGIIFSFIFGVLTSSLSASKEAQKRMAVDHIGRFFIQKITSELTSATLLPSSGRGALVGRHFTVKDKSRDEIHFTSFSQTYYTPIPRAGMAEISYFFRTGKSGVETLMRRESDIIEAPVDQGGESMELTAQVEELSIRYKRGETWGATWNSAESNALPEVVSIELRLTAEDKTYFYSAMARPQT